jgi:hypothetical protein
MQANEKNELKNSDHAFPVDQRTSQGCHIWRSSHCAPMESAVSIFYLSVGPTEPNMTLRPSNNSHASDFAVQKSTQHWSCPHYHLIVSSFISHARSNHIMLILVWQGRKWNVIGFVNLYKLR